jgi:CheY-like chemotaxis protein
MQKEKYNLLLVDDSEDDRLFMRRAITKHPQLIIVGEVCDGEEAISYLDGKGVYQDREKHPLPDAMLLDLKMPKRTGHEVLQWMQCRSFETMFVAVISGSFLPEDVARSMAYGADAYFKKTAMKAEQEAMLREILQRLDKAHSV